MSRRRLVITDDDASQQPISRPATPRRPTGTPWRAPVGNPAVLSDPSATRRVDPRTTAVIGGLCGALVLGGACYALGRSSRPGPDEVRATVSRAVRADRERQSRAQATKRPSGPKAAAGAPTAGPRDAVAPAPSALPSPTTR